MEQNRRSVATPDGAVLSVHIYTHRHAPPQTPTIVLAHDWTLTHESWRPVVTALGDIDARIVLWDQRGHGRSAIGLHRKEIETLSVDHLARDLRAVVQNVVPRESPLVLAGHSMGGMTVMSYAAQFAEEFASRVRGVVLVSTPVDGLELDRSYGEATLMRMLAKGMPLPPGRAVKVKSERALLFGEGAAEEAVDATRRQVAGTRLTTFGAFYRALQDVDLRDGLPALHDVPVAIVTGRRDTLTLSERARALWLALPHATYTELPTAGHMLTYEATDVLADSLRALVSQAAST
jgi:pimeloyl-ACP methyl ester carboxylesterase